MSDLPAPLVIAIVVAVALVVTRLSGVVLRHLVRRMADRSRKTMLDGRSSVTRFWRAGSSRGVLDVADGGEGRRRQRVDSAARMLNHVVAVVVWIGVLIAVFHVFDIDAAFFLSSAGFIGAGVAIGGQHKVNDYLTGLSVLFEDRYGAGDSLVIERPGREPIHAVVEHVGLFTTRLREADSALHIPNASLELVRNLSQQAHVERLRLHVETTPEAAPVSAGEAAATVRQMAGQEHLTELIFVGDIAAHERDDGDIDVAVRTARPLDNLAKARLIRRAEQRLADRR